jgi:hypothetical protein
MSLDEAQARIKARVWQAIAQNDLDLSSLNKETRAGLVDLVTEAALLEMDSGLSKSLLESQREAAPVVSETAAPSIDGDPNDDIEVILWEGRPFLSLTVKYIITDERIRVIEGLIGKVRRDIELVRIQSMDQTQRVGERLLNLGDVVIRSHDPLNPIIIFNNVANPQEVHEILRRAVLKARDKYKLSYREQM